MSLQYHSSLSSLPDPTPKRRSLSTGTSGSLALVSSLSILSTIAMTAAAFFLNHTMKAMALFPFMVILLIVCGVFLPCYLLVFVVSYIYDRNTILALKLPSKYETIKSMVMLGSLTAMQGVSIVFSNIHVSPLMQSLTGPTILTVPFCLVISLAFGARYTVFQVLAAVKTKNIHLM
jgi:hypothetical protein